jgi:GT2 family glycosyltransferase
MDVSVIVVNRNTREILRSCLVSLLAQTAGPSFEVAVVDNGSTDGSVEMVRDEFPQALLISNTLNRGFAAANNQAMRLARGRYVLLLNSDTVVRDGAIQKTLAFAEEHPEAAVVGCRVLNADGSLQPTCFRFPGLINMLLSATYLYKVFPRSRFFGRERMTWWDRDDVREVDVVTGCFMLVRREAIEDVGLMDERFFMYGEETDWCYRFTKAGWKNLFYPGASIVHLGGESTRARADDMNIQLRRSILEFMRKHRGALSYGTARLLTSLFYATRMPYWWVRSLRGTKESRRDALARAQLYRRGTLSMLLASVPSHGAQ